tara:strand:+ start:495 stop:1223 length:729 start_codon:yes stop_codon:yes gene_type:complete
MKLLISIICVNFVSINQRKNLKKSDFIIPLAWPETMVIPAGAWYDFLTRKIGFMEGGKYRAGHSATLMVNAKNGKVSYFDFGRYHTPLGFGRVRDEKTDCELKLDTIAKCKNGKIQNIEAILLEIASNKSNHGDGSMYASVLSGVDFEKGYLYAKKMQKRGAIPYGPFIKNGTNCSRFVASMMQATNPSIIKKIRLKYPFCISPSPKRNVGIANTTYYIVNNKNCKCIKRSKIESYLNSIER